jgi:endonuclease G
MNVVKSGRRTGVTYGRVRSIGGKTLLNYLGIDRIVSNIVTVEPRTPFVELSAGGDSGAWWLDEATRQAVGLHFAGSNQPERALALDMPSVLDALDIDIVI